MRAKILSCVFAFAVTACMNDGDAPIQAPGIAEAVVFEGGPHVAQCAPVAITLRQSAAKLTTAGIDVRRSSCGFIEGVAYPAVCGAGTGQILLHDIPATSLAAAEAAGFASVESLPDWRRDRCPQYLHAIEVAQETTSCVEARNRVLQIQTVANPDERVILLDQAGNCADASYRQVLFGAEGDDVLCSNADSIAGPQKSCAVASRTAMFETILANLHLADLGLGIDFNVAQVYPAN